MTNINLTVRQRAIASSIPICDSLADVGCDHGYIGLSALLSRKVSRLYLCDISAPSLHKAVTTANSMGIEHVSYHCQDGLGSIDCQCAVIAGMGGLEMMSILDKAQHLPRHLVLQPMRNIMDVRQYLLAHGYNIISDFIVHDVKFYDIIVAQQGLPQSQSVLQLTFGKSNLDSPTLDFALYLQKEIQKCNKILHQHSVPSIAIRLALLQQAHQYIGGKYEQEHSGISED